MSGCRQRDVLLEAMFAEADLTRAQAAHAATCSECTRALAQGRRFESELNRIGLELSPEPMLVTPVGRVEAVLGGGKGLMWRVGAVATLAVLAVAILAASSAWWTLTQGVGSIFTLPWDKAAAARAFGVPESAVVMVPGGAVTTRIDGAFLQLVAIGDRDVDPSVLEVIGPLPIDGPEGGAVAGFAVACRTSPVGEIYAAFGMSAPQRDPRVRVEGATGTLAIQELDRISAVTYTFVAEPDTVDVTRLYRVRFGHPDVPNDGAGGFFEASDCRPETPPSHGERDLVPSASP